MRSPSRLRLRRALLPLALLAVALAMRALALADAGRSAGRCDLAGIVADAAGAAAVTAAALLLGRLHRLLALVPALLWALVAYGNFEHVRSLGAPLRLVDWRYLADPTFVGGSLLHPARPLALLLALAVAGAAAWWSARPPAGWRALAMSAGAAAALAAAALAVPYRDPCGAWRQSHPLVALLQASARPDPMAASAREPPDVLLPDLGGIPWTAAPHGRPNVLLVLLEGVSGVQLPVVASHHGVEPSLVMPRLGDLATRHTVAVRFFTQQRQTQRGEYALLCGDLPKLAYQPGRFSELAAGAWRRPCLPSLLAAAGYRTAYLQSAPLPFMQKDLALPATGFAEVAGDDPARPVYHRNPWGADDKAFLERGLATLRELRRGGEPWFLTLLTVGTHHPFVVPPGWSPTDGLVPEEPRHLPFLYADEAFAAFWEGLEAADVFADTLVVVTSDEALGAAASATDALQALSQSLGFALLRTPGGERRVVADPYVQSDLALSVLDYLGLPVPEPVLGRSLFRDYATPRPVFFANSYLDTVYGLFPGGRLVSCGERGGPCGLRRASGGALLAAATDPPTAPHPQEVALLRQVQAFSLRPSPAAGEPRTTPLLAETLVPLPDGSTYRLLFGGQHLALPAGAAAEVDLEVEVLGDSGWVHLRHDLIDQGERLYGVRLPVLAPGDRVRLRYTVQAGRALRDVEVRASVDRLAGRGLALHFRRAGLRIEPAGAPRMPTTSSGEPRVEVLEERVERHAPPPTLRFGLDAVAAADRHSCLELAADRSLSGDCPPGLLLSGPRLYAPYGSRLRATLRAQGVGSGTLRLLAGSAAQGIVLVEGEPLRLLAGQTASLRLEGAIEAGLNEVQLAVEWQPQGSAAKVALRDLALEVELP
ncbi:MAG TPA: sulfatase-like hydrolase/transferase [Thermoanaerobaculia bacterium]|nr:sulfatase-like hydrolase/transferase [Thermoanaerobaculia bacterium]